MAYVSNNEDDEELKKKQAGALGGEAEAAAAPGQDAAAKAQPYTQTGFASAKNIFDKNQGAADQYDVTQPFNEDLAKDKAGTQTGFKTLQDSLGKQVQGAKSNDADLAEAVAAGQGSAGWDKISKALAPQQLSGDLGARTKQFNANDVTNLNTAPGIQSAIANQAEKKGVQNYSQGMGSLDAAIYQRDAGFRNKVGGLANQYAAADKERADYEGQAAAAVTKSNKELGDFAGNLKSQLGGQGEALKLANDTTRGGAATNRRIGQENSDRASAEAQSKAMIDQIAGGMTDPLAKSRFLQTAYADHGANGFNLSSFYKQGAGDQYDYSAEDAGKFNNIMGLLNGTERAQASTGVKSNFDKAAMENALKGVATKNETNAASERATEAQAVREKTLRAEQAATDVRNASKDEQDAIFNPLNKHFYEPKYVLKRATLGANPQTYQTIKNEVMSGAKQGASAASSAGGQVAEQWHKTFG